MSKILELPKFKPVICLVCGCKYEFKKGDTLHAVSDDVTYDDEYNVSLKNGALFLRCPICGINNKAEFIDEDD